MTAFAISATLGDIKMMRLFLDYCAEHGLDSIANGSKYAEKEAWYHPKKNATLTHLVK